MHIILKWTVAYQCCSQIHLIQVQVIAIDSKSKSTSFESKSWAFGVQSESFSYMFWDK